MRAVLKGIGWVVLSLLLLLILGLILALGTSPGSRWVLGMVPGLHIEQFEGRLGGRWRAERLLWERDGSRVEVMAPRFQWSPSCLLKLTLCLDEIIAGDITLRFPPAADEPTGEPFSLPDIQLPLALQVNRIEIGRLRLNDSEHLQSVQLRADWRAAGLDIQKLQLRREDLALDLTGRLQPNGQWPLKLQGEASLQAPGEQAWTLNLALEGEVREQVALNIDSQGYLNGNLSGEIWPLESQLPATLRLHADGFLPSPDLPDTLRLDELELTANGNLQDGYQLLGTTRLPGAGGAIRLALEGLINAAGARIDRLELDAGNQRWVRLNGNLDWKDAFKADARLAWQDFPWWRLYPAAGEPPVVLRELTAEVEYDDGDYLGHFDSALSGPAGDFTLRSPVSGNLEVVHLPQLELVAGKGRAVGNLSVGFADKIDWETRLNLSEFDPSYWLAELPGNLGGSLTSRGTLRDEQLQGDASLDLTGTLRGQPTHLQLQATGQDARWSLPSLNLRVGDNRIQGSGSWAKTLAGELALDLAQLEQLWPDLAGQLAGHLSLSGTPAAPQGRLNLNGQNLRLQENRLQQLQLAAVLDEGGHANLELIGEGLRAGETSLGELLLKADGTRNQHQGSVQLQGPLLDLSLALDGGLQGEIWRGRLLSINLAAAEQNWSLQQPAAIERLANGRINLGEHCLASGPATLCGDEQRLMPDPHLRYHLRDFALSSLAPYLPEDFAWQAELNADIELELPSAGPSGRIRVDAGPGVLRVRDEDSWLEFPYQTFALNSSLTPQRIDNHLRFLGGALGELDIKALIDPRSEAKPIDGAFRLSGLDLSVARPFMPQVDRLEGQLNGAGTLAGSLLQPLIEGQLTLSDGEISGGELPVSFEELQARLFIEGERLRIDGDWRSGEQGQGQLAGSLAWAEALALDVRISGEHLPVVVEPYAELQVAPDLHITLDGEQLAITGRVNVPQGDITIRELPPSTVKISEDAVIVGQQAEEEASPLAIRMDIDVEVGQERLSFAGFGLTADLAGYLHIGDNLDARGELQLNRGRYRAYGQRLTIRRARLLFTGMISQPFLDIEAIRRIEAYDVVAGLRITGNVEQPRIDVFSEPAMSQEQALSYLVLGRPLGADTGDSNLLAQAALGLGLAGSASITGGLAQRLGIEDFMLDTEGSGASTSVVATGRLTDRLALRYGVGVFEPASTVALRYRITKRVFLEAASGLASSLDLFYRRDF